MNRFQIRDILKAHREHFRVLPTIAQNELNGIITAIDADVPITVKAPSPVKVAAPVKKPVKETKRVVGNRTSKATKNPKRPRR